MPALSAVPVLARTNPGGACWCNAVQHPKVWETAMSADATPLLLGERVPGQAVLEELMAVQSRVPRRSWLQRVFGASPLSPESMPWYKGALGEIAVGRILEGLGPEWLVLHAVPVGTGSSDIDHVLVGPAGVFTLNTKNHSGQPAWGAGRALLVAGKRTHHIRSAAYEAARAAKLLGSAVGFPVEVTGVVVIVQPKSLTIKARPERVAVAGTHGSLPGCAGASPSWARSRWPRSRRRPSGRRPDAGSLLPRAICRPFRTASLPSG